MTPRRAAAGEGTRRVDCVRASQCLSVAVRNNWPALDCGACDVRESDAMPLHVLAVARAEATISEQQDGDARHAAKEARRVARPLRRHVRAARRENTSMSKYDELPVEAQDLIRASIEAAKPATGALFRALREQGFSIERIGTQQALDRYVHKERHRRKGTKVAAVAAKLAAVRAVEAPRKEPTTRAPAPRPRQPVVCAGIEIRPDGSLRTDSPELAVRLARLLAAEAG